MNAIRHVANFIVMTRYLLIVFLVDFMAITLMMILIVKTPSGESKLLIGIIVFISTLTIIFNAFAGYLFGRHIVRNITF